MRLKKRGDTIIEVVFAFMVFSTVSVASIGIMNSGLNQAQRSLEVTMARNSVDSQAEALRFLQNNFSAEREWSESKRQFSDIWLKITTQGAMTPAEVSLYAGGDINDVDYKSCDEYYNAQVYADKSKAFAINTRLLLPKGVVSDSQYSKLVDKIIITKNTPIYTDPLHDKVMRPSSLHPRLTYTTLSFEDLSDGTVTKSSNEDDTLAESQLYREVYSVEGIWDIAVKGNSSTYASSKPQYYDFYIRTCWQSVGTKAPSTLSTIIRLYNPEAVD
jgi:hypothetical protein